MAGQQERTTADRWEQAFRRQSHDAAVGRLSRGLLHNLNGALQIFSLQTDLLTLAVAEAETLIRQLLTMELNPEARSQTCQLGELLRRRAEGVSQMRGKVRDCEAIVRRTVLLSDFSRESGEEPYTINSVIRTEMEFLNAEPFFKHKVAKEVQLAADPPPLLAGQLALHQILFALLENSLVAVRGGEAPRIVVRSSLLGGITTVVVEDNGPGVADADRERIFAPFYSTWPDHLGLGLHLARTLAAELRGTLVCEPGPGGAAFRLTLPPG